MLSKLRGTAYLVELVHVEGEDFAEAFAHLKHVQVVAGLSFLKL